MTSEKAILRARKKDKSNLITLTKIECEYNPYLDEIVNLCGVLSVLDKHNLAVSKNEVRTAFNHFYNRDFHGDKKSYLTWIYRQFHVKEGTIVRTSNVRSQGSKKRGLIANDSNKTDILSKDKTKGDNIPTNPSLNQNMPLKPHIMGREGSKVGGVE